MIENYEDDTVDAPTRQPDTQQFRYFGSLLLRQGGEVGYHGYNHQPLVLPDTDYKDLYSYRQWPGEDAIVAAMDELIAFQKTVLPHTNGSVYVPPSNILSAAGRQVLGSKVPADPAPLPAPILRMARICPMCRSSVWPATAWWNSPASSLAAWWGIPTCGWLP